MNVCNAYQGKGDNQIRISHSYPADAEGRHWINAKVQNAQGSFQSVRMLSDTGNDITILTRSTAMSLGYNPATTSGNIFRVEGISGHPQKFKEIHRLVIIGNIPIKIPIGLAMSDEALSENLLGREGVMDTGKIAFLFDNDSVDIIDRRKSRVAVCGDMM